jgi:hypothetical protein
MKFTDTQSQPADHRAMSPARPLATITELLKAKRFEEARAEVEAQLVAKPDDPILLRRLAWACNHLGDRDAAEDALDRLQSRRNRPDAPTPAAPTLAYDHDSVSDLEYLELVGRTPGESGDASSDDVDEADRWTAETSEASAHHPESLPPLPIPGDKADDAEAEADPLTDPSANDALPPEVEEAPQELLKEALEELPAFPIPFVGFDDLDERLAAVDFIEVQEVRQSTKLQGAARVSRRLRARQHAADLLARHGHRESANIDAIAEIFFHFGWNSCKRALDSQLLRGVTPAELAIAHKARLAWASNPLLTSAASIGGEWARTPQSPFPSWPMAIALIRAFSGPPEEAEIHAFLERELDRYLASDTLHRKFASFASYLVECRLDQSGRHLPPVMATDFEPDWHGTETDAMERWEPSMPLPRVCGLLGPLEPILHRLTLQNSQLGDLA